MNEVEFVILDASYFLIGYPGLLRETELDREILDEGLRALLKKKYLRQMQFSPSAGDFLIMDIPDTQELHLYHYLASKEGLLAHNQ